MKEKRNKMRNKGVLSEKQLQLAREYNYLKTKQPKKYEVVKGYDFSQPFDLANFLAAFKTTGFQATHLGAAIDLIKKMRQERLKIVLTYTSNIITSGIRDVIRWLVQNKHVHALCTSGGGIEEDIMKCFGDFIIGSFEADSKKLYDKGMNRTGNIYVPSKLYVKFEKFLLPILEDFYQRQLKQGKIVNSVEMIREMGKRINNPKSVLYWAYRRKISVFCPSILDGAIGDVVWFFKHKHKEFKIDVAEDIFNMNNWPFKARESGIIALGAGSPRHYVLNAHIFKGGAKYVVYLTTTNEWDGSTSSSKPTEAYTWGKINLFKPFQKNSVHVEGDITITFPLVVAGAFMNKNGKK